MNRIIKVISGGQTGADIGGLKAARRARIHTGGWMPRGWQTEQGPKPEYHQIYRMTEHSEPDFKARTEQNVIDSDVTILITGTRSHLSPGSKLTRELCRKHNKPLYHVLDSGFIVAKSSWLVTSLNRNLEQGPITINIAGNRESVHPGIEKFTYKLLVPVFLLFNESW